MDAKGELRKAARERRRALAYSGHAIALAAHAGALGVVPGLVVGAYHALPDEADPAPLLEALAERGAHVAFPRVAAKNMPLTYHRVPDGEMLSPSSYGIHEPQAHWPPVRPGLLLVPLLAFDATGHRLGYGGGFYDRTLALLGAPAIGIAYAGQEVASLPAEPHDRRLSAILTEQGLRRFS